MKKAPNRKYAIWLAVLGFISFFMGILAIIGVFGTFEYSELFIVATLMIGILVLTGSIFILKK